MSAASRRSSRPRPQFKLGDAFGESFRILGKHFIALVLLMFLVSLPFLAVLGVIIAAPEAFGAAAAPLVLIITFAVLLIMGPVTTGAATKIVAGDFTGRSVGFGQALSAAFSRLGSLLGASLLYGLVVAVGFVLLIVPGFLFATWFYVTIPVVVVERKGPFEALSRSKELVSGNGGSVFGLWLLVTITYSVISEAIGAVVTGAAGGEESLAGIFLGMLVDVFATTLTVVAPTVAYFRLRSGREGIEVERLAALVDAIGDEDEEE